jgi:YD repeat-containing protein
LERAVFHRRIFTWKEGPRRFEGRYSWNSEGRLISKEENQETHLYAYDGSGNRVACYKLDPSGSVTGREIQEWDDQSRILRRISRSADSPAEEISVYEHDDAGRLTAERRGSRVRVEKRDRAGKLLQEYFYNGDKPDLVTDYSYSGNGNLESVIIKNPEGGIHRRTLFTRDEKERPSAEIVYDGDSRIIKDELYAYGASHGDRWLERVTWIPDGKSGGKRRPKEVIYRSFTYGSGQSRAAGAVQRTLAFSNGVYTGPVSGNRPEGRGVFQYNDESRYDGEFHDGTMDGDGRMTWPDGRVMEGVFRAGLLEGKGRCHWPDGSIYSGGFRKGLMDGPGVFTWADGTRFEGLFDKGRRTDQGAWERPGDT